MIIVNLPIGLMVNNASEYIHAVKQGDSMTRGKVKWFNDEKGFGFIAPEGGKKDVFVHHSNVDEDNGIRENDQVQFDIVEGIKGPSATRVRLV